MLPATGIAIAIESLKGKVHLNVVTHGVFDGLLFAGGLSVPSLMFAAMGMLLMDKKHTPELEEIDVCSDELGDSQPNQYPPSPASEDQILLDARGLMWEASRKYAMVNHVPLEYKEDKEPVMPCIE